MTKLLAALLFASLILVPTKAAPLKPDESASCGAISLSLIYVALPPPPPFTFRITINGAVGPYMLYFGGHPGTGIYKGCPFGTSGEVQIGPLTGDINTTFQTDSYFDMVGYWQCLSATQTSNVVHFQ